MKYVINCSILASRFQITGVPHFRLQQITVRLRVSPFGYLTPSLQSPYSRLQVSPISDYSRLQITVQITPDYRCPPFLQITADYSRLQITVQITGVPHFCRLQQITADYRLQFRLQVSPFSQITSDYRECRTDYSCPPCRLQITPYTLQITGVPLFFGRLHLTPDYRTGVPQNSRLHLTADYRCLPKR